MIPKYGSFLLDNEDKKNRRIEEIRKVLEE
jgi:hypothetical protein